jgi:hypothetical protein
MLATGWAIACLSGIYFVKYPDFEGSAKALNRRGTSRFSVTGEQRDVPLALLCDR